MNRCISKGFRVAKHFGWYYSFLKKRGSFDLRKQVQDLSKHRGWKIDTIYFMTKVFSELGFVKIENGLAFVIEDAGKKSLSEAPSYQTARASDRIGRDACIRTIYGIEKLVR